MRVDLSAAERLLDFNATIKDPRRSCEQLEGAVALFNMLEENRVAYLADEVGMGKTYVALGAMALLRHYRPASRILVIAPRENIQAKWEKEIDNFVRANVVFNDLRVRFVDGRPARPVKRCRSLLEFLRETLQDPERDFILRLTSFSLPLAGEEGGVASERGNRLREEILSDLPWLDRARLGLRDKMAFKLNVARAICCAIGRFDLVVVDEAHHLRHGLGEKVAARNRILSALFGHPAQAEPEGFPGYGPRVDRLLLMSATPIEDAWAHLKNQFDLFDRGKSIEGLEDPGLGDDEKKRIASRVLIRRVARTEAAGTCLTKNQYRREWRAGGVEVHDEPIRMEDPRHRLIVALMQKKVQELLGGDRFKNTFQIGMLASFESFLETAKLKPDDERAGKPRVAKGAGGEEAAANFDGAEQTEDAREREGVDVDAVNRLASSYRERFGREMPHPKMDRFARALARSFHDGRKHLVFVRRVRSVDELKRKLETFYDLRVVHELKRNLPPGCLPRFIDAVKTYGADRKRYLGRGEDARRRMAAGEEADAREGYGRGDASSFFAWYFRGKGPDGVLSGAAIQERLGGQNGLFGTFFEEHHLATLLGTSPEETPAALVAALGGEAERVRAELQGRASRILSAALRNPRAERFRAVQAAAVGWLAEREGPLRAAATHCLAEHFPDPVSRVAREAPPLFELLTQRTFFTELARRPALRRRIWPEPESGDATARLRLRTLRAQCLSAAARLGHAFLDFYILTIRKIGSLEPGDQAKVERAAGAETLIDLYLQLLEREMEAEAGGSDHRFGAFRELSAIADHFDLILDVNLPQARRTPLTETRRRFGTLLAGQQPVGGMSGRVNDTLVRQFRMPGYPFILVTTDVLQEGEDLHTFCSTVHHYGMSWTPSAMEQRIGRVDRVRSETHRRLSTLTAPPDGERMLQVHYPYLQDTVEVLQVRRVFARMNEFMRLMHEGIARRGGEERTIEIGRELRLPPADVAPISEPLRSAFPVDPEWLRGEIRETAVDPLAAEAIARRFVGLKQSVTSAGPYALRWRFGSSDASLTADVALGERRQRIRLTLHALGRRLLIRCESKVGVLPAAHARRWPACPEEPWIRVMDHPETARGVERHLAVDVLLSDSAGNDARRVEWAIRTVASRADEMEKILLDGIDATPSDDDPEAGDERPACAGKAGDA